MQSEKLPAFITLWTTCSFVRKKNPCNILYVLILSLQFNLSFLERKHSTSYFSLCSFCGFFFFLSFFFFCKPLKNSKLKRKSLSKFQLQGENKNTVGVMLHAFKIVSLLKQTAAKICPKVDPIASSLHSSNNKTHIWPMTFLATHHLFPCVEAKDDGWWLKSNGSIGLSH